MRTFLLMDHSLRWVGSHHFEYANQLLQTAQDRGYKIAIATHREFAEQALFPSDWTVLPRFPRDTYTKFSTTRPSGSHKKPSRNPRLRTLAAIRSHSFHEYWSRFQEVSRVRAFSKACRDVWRQVSLERGDLVFLPTVSDHDLMGLAHFLARQDGTEEIDWHLQFHFKFLEGRPPDYASQESSVRQLAQQCTKILSPLNRHRLHFYSTTEELSEQFNRLQIGNFHTLPYLGDSNRKQRSTARKDNAPLTICCAGNVREEKGQQHLAPIVHELWETHFEPGRTQLLIQSGSDQFSLLPEQAAPSLEETATHPLGSAAPIVHLPHPLDAKSYSELIRQSDIGLFLYDSRAYYGRAAGILVEMLMCGVPVIVPAGSWLAEQISEPTQVYLEHLCSSQETLARISGRDLSWAIDDIHAGDTSGQAGILAIGSHGAKSHLDVPTGSGHLRIGLRFATGTPKGFYLLIEIRQLDSTGRETARNASLVGPRDDEALAAALQHLNPETSRVELVLRNSYGIESIGAEGIEISFLPFTDASHGVHPSGAVGLAAVTAEQVPRLVDEMVTHYAHYRSSAERFAVAWRKKHSPINTLSILESRNAEFGDALRSQVAFRSTSRPSER